MAEPTIGVLCCSLLESEVNACLVRLGEQAAPRGIVPSMCHMRRGAAQMPATTLEKLLPQTDQVVGICLNCCRPPRGEPGNGGRVASLKHPRLTLIQVQTQGELFLGADAAEHALGEGDFLVLPGWVLRWQDVVERVWRFDAETAPLFFADSAHRLLYLETRDDPAAWQAAQDMAAFVQLPVERRHVGVSHLELLLRAAFQQARAALVNARCRGDLSRVSEAAAENGVLVDFVTRLADLLSEQEVVARLVETARLLFGPEDVSFAPAPEDDPPAPVPEGGPPGAALAPTSEARVQPDAASLQVVVRLGPRMLGTLNVVRVAFPQYMDRYLSVARVACNAAAIALAAARLHRREQNLVRALALKVGELDAFVYMASHDLQAPVRRLLSFAELLKRDLGADLPADAATVLGFMTQAARDMSNLIRALLSLSMAARHPLTMTRFPLELCVRQASQALSLVLDESGASVTHGPLPEVDGDPTLLAQLFQNLIGNAVKYRGDRPPHVQITVEERTDGTVFGVRDNGIGIDPAHAELIFEPFRRLCSGTCEGSGIGLATCRKIVQRHNGALWVEPAPGGGSHFRFTLGVARPL